MKFLTFVFVLILACINAQAQKENNVWVGGDKCGLDFNSGTAVPFLRNETLDINTTDASICDANGNLLFYSNGFRVMNKNMQLMQNGDNLDIGDYFDWGYDELSVEDGAVIVPVPGDSDKYYLFHVDLNYTSFGTFTNVLMPTHLFYSIVDMALDGGLGGIVSGQKDLILLSDTLTSSGFKVVKHANGRDYWLICHEFNSDNYYRFLIDPTGVHGPYGQHIGYVYTGHNAAGFCTLHFNEAAAAAAQLSYDSTSVQLYDFDRCTGEFSNLRNFKISDTLYYTAGAAFSPSGRYFYATGNLYYIWQFDVTAPDIFASRKLVAHYDGAMNPAETNFFQLRLAPDGKIYVHAYDYIYSMHVINHPDSSAEACGFVENAITVHPLGGSWQGFPNIVNYHLGPVTGSVCDSLTDTIHLPTPTFTFGVYPNPFVDELQLSVSGATTNALVDVYNVLGQKIYSNSLSPTDHFIHQTVDLSKCSSGVYFVVVDVNGQRYARKVIKK